MGAARRPKPQLLSVRLPPQLAAKVARLARRRRITQEAIVREALEMLPADAIDGSFYERARRYCGIFRGPRDLSTNQKYLSDFGV
jgi:hypothetical protein